MTFEPHPITVLKPQREHNRIVDLHTKIACLDAHSVTQVNVVHFTRQFAAISAEKFVEKLCNCLNMQQLIIGADFRFGKDRSGDAQLLKQLAKQLGFKLHIVSDYYLGSLRASSKLLRTTMMAGNLEKVAELLGRSYQFSGRVLAGERIGRTLGFPTANVSFAGNIALRGIFAAKVYLEDGTSWPAALSVGYRPVFNSKRLSIEAHLIGFAGELYGKRIVVEPVQKVRDEQRYPDLDSLSAAIQADIQHCEDILGVSASAG